ncbi:MAG: extracellular solute-binding protein [Clostridiales bacterium]|nr:extracellular solute-binding protein [Clostridiales bacterium]
MKKRLLATMLAALMMFSLGACSPSPTPSAPTAPQTDADTKADATKPADTNQATNETATDAEPVTIKVFTNNPDRTSDQGLIEETIFASYMAENPNVTIEVEALEDDPYKVKFKAYSTGSDMPDLVSVWGQPGFIDEVIDAGILAELNPADYADYGFVEGSLSGFSKNGTLYGLPRNTDVAVCFYNKDMFAANGWNVPTTYQEFVSLSQAAKDAGNLGVAIDGQGAWSLTIFLTDMLAKFNGAGITDKIASAIASGDWSDPAFANAGQLFADTASSIFMNGFESTDYDTAKNLYMSGQAAMYYVGSWEMAMANSPDVTFEVGAFNVPKIDGGAGETKDIAAWNGGGYSVTANSKVKEEATKLLNYMFLPENWTRLAWENNVCMSAQDFSRFMTGNETAVQAEIVDIFTGAKSISGTPINDMGTSQFKTNSESAIQELAIQQISVDEFYSKLIP